ncbi:MAG: protein translocase subunit SecF [Acidobacteria bacterium]|nr:protein translocase subunit SecF [Acidobacteriota bacterium]
MRFFSSVNVDWLGKKNLFFGISAALIVASFVSFLARGGLRYGVDFSGGTLVYVKFKENPQLDAVRAALKQRGLGDSTIQRFGAESDREVIISLDQSFTAKGSELDQDQSNIADTLNLSFRPADSGNKLDLNNLGAARLETALASIPELSQAMQKLSQSPVMVSSSALAKAAIDYRNSHGGLFHNFDELKALGMAEEVLSSFRARFYLGEFAVIKTEIVGPKVGKALQRQAVSATLYALVGMLVYIGWRFKGAVYGTAAMLAVFHDVLITVGFFSFFDKEISLTVIAALLTLVGYSTNDTIVVFDRIRENLKLRRREPLTSVVNKSINQTLSRTILTSGLTFLTVLSLYLFGGEVINGFAFAMVFGIIVGSYSSIAIASPLVVMWHDYKGKKKSLAKAASF